MRLSYFVLFYTLFILGCGSDDSEQECCGDGECCRESAKQQDAEVEPGEKSNESESKWYTWENTSIETLGVETLSEFSSIIKFLSPRAWRVTRGEGEVMMIGRGTYSASKMRGVNFFFGSSKAMTSGKIITFNADHGFKIKKILETPVNAPANYILQVYFNHNNEILTLYDDRIQLTWGNSALTMRPN